MKNIIPLPAPSSLPTLTERYTYKEVKNPLIQDQAIPEQVIQEKIPQEPTPQEITNEELMPLNFEEVVINHEQRLQNLEAILLRIRGSI
jgi:hypothetical protein